MNDKARKVWMMHRFEQLREENKRLNKEGLADALAEQCELTASLQAQLTRAREALEHLTQHLAFNATEGVWFFDMKENPQVIIAKALAGKEAP